MLIGKDRDVLDCKGTRGSAVASNWRWLREKIVHMYRDLNLQFAEMIEYVLHVRPGLSLLNTYMSYDGTFV